MIVGVLREVHSRENRVPLIPEHTAKLVEAGAEILVQSGIGHTLNIHDEVYKEAGASIAEERTNLLGSSDLVLSVNGPSREEAQVLKHGAICISLLDPFREKVLIEMLRHQRVSAISLEMIPRITRAQKMDVLSSQANLAGYMAVILAVVRELSEILGKNGAEVRYAIHPVAGRMPGHMNVLLAEANVLYEQLAEVDDVNPTMEMVDVCLVIGANDVVNPTAREVPSSPIYGMPIVNADKAKTVIVFKRSMASGFAGIENPLFTRDNTRMLFGDAKATVQQLISEFKAAP